MTEPLDGGPKPVLKTNGGRPPEFATRLLGRDVFPAEIARPRRHEVDLHVLADRLPNTFRHFQNRNLPVAFKVIGLILRDILHREYMRLGHVPNVDEVAVLLPFAGDRERNI